MISDRRFFKRTGILLLGLTHSVVSFGNEIKEVALSKENVSTVTTQKTEPTITASAKTDKSKLEQLIKNQYNNKNIDLNVNTSLKNMRDSGSYERPNTNEYTANRKTQQGTPDMKLSKEQLLSVAEKIFQNETGGVRNNLVDWNDGENFPSLGIGHFTWFKASGGRSGFGDSLPDMIAYYKQKGIELPKLLAESRYSPWKSKSELMAKKDLVDELVKSINGMTEQRATTIARTETSKSVNSTSYEMSKKIMKEKRWVHIGGQKTHRENHKALDGEWVPIDYKWSLQDGIEAEHPHQDGLPASEVINCRCKVVFR